MSGLGGKGVTPTGNQPSSAVQGGASAYPTPANNSGGGSGWGDSGFIKGGLSGKSKNLSSSGAESGSGQISSLSGKMSKLEEQKASGRENNLSEIGGIPTHENASFMTHKPAGPSTLPGWEKAKGVVNSVIGNE
ncbi:hypothetical protein BJX70DRAFT_101056 [Aspergillus crustosus]